MTNRLLSGNHSALAIIDLQTKILWYGDSLGYPIPSNIDIEFKPVLNTLSNATKSRMCLSKKAFHVTNFDSQGSHVCSCLCKHYPLQTCASICGLVTVTVSSLLASCSNFSTWHDMTGSDKKLHVTSSCKVVMKPTDHSPRIRLSVASWILNDNIQMSQLIDFNHLEKASTRKIPLLNITRRHPLVENIESATKPVQNLIKFPSSCCK